MKTNKRFVYFLAVAFVIILGLASRKYGDILPSFLAEHAGDALWGMMVYFGFRLLFNQNSIYLAILISIICSFGIEFSQLYQANWINQLRSTLLGALVLGKGFLIVDLFRYTIGIIIAALIDQFSTSR